MELKTQWQRDVLEKPELWGRLIAIRDGKIVAVADTYQELGKAMGKEDYSVYHVPKNNQNLRVLPLKIKNLRR